jgi:hypothetical protein
LFRLAYKYSSATVYVAQRNAELPEPIKKVIGQLKLVELREKAITALGEKFSLREYHNLVLQLGVVPLSLLEREVNAWIRVKGGKA